MSTHSETEKVITLHISKEDLDKALQILHIGHMRKKTHHHTHDLTVINPIREGFSLLPGISTVSCCSYCRHTHYLPTHHQQTQLNRTHREDGRLTRPQEHRNMGELNEWICTKMAEAAKEKGRRPEKDKMWGRWESQVLLPHCPQQPPSTPSSASLPHHLDNKTSPNKPKLNGRKEGNT